MSAPALVVVVPTKDRARLAAAAVAALLRDPGADFRVVVSDTSGDARAARWLERVCRRRADPRLTYLRAPELSMGTHWDWAIEQALDRTGAGHVTVHYDRQVFKRGGVRHLLAAMARHEGRVITFARDQIVPAGRGHRVWQAPWTGRDYLVASAAIARRVVEGRVGDLGHTWPVLSNCVVSRADLGAIRARFGSICDAAAPDAAFASRICAITPCSVHLDRTLAVMWGGRRSNGLGYLTGMSTDFPEFMRRWGDRPWIQNVPIPGLDLGCNLLFNEYELTRQVAPELPAITREGYLAGLADGLVYIAEPARRGELEAVLRHHGWTGERSPRSVVQPPGAGKDRPPVRRVVGTIVGWPERHRVAVALLTGLRVRPDHITGHRFPLDRVALRCALAFPRCAESSLPPLRTYGRELLTTPV